MVKALSSRPNHLPKCWGQISTLEFWGTRTPSPPPEPSPHGSQGGSAAAAVPPAEPGQVQMGGSLSHAQNGAGVDRGWESPGWVLSGPALVLTSPWCRLGKGQGRLLLSARTGILAQAAGSSDPVADHRPALLDPCRDPRAGGVPFQEMVAALPTAVLPTKRA